MSTTPACERMILFDVNVLVEAFRADTPHHAQARRAVLSALTGIEPVAIDDPTLAAVVRLVTNSRIFKAPSTPSQALDFCAQVRQAPAASPLPPDDVTWQHFARLVDDLGLRGNDVPDAWLAARALALRARLVSFDRGLRRYPGVEVDILEP